MGLGVRRRQHADRAHRWFGPAHRVRPRLPHLAAVHRRVVRAASSARCARSHRVRQPDAHVRPRCRRGRDADRRVALGGLIRGGTQIGGRAGARHPVPGGDRRHHRAHRPQPVDRLAAPHALDDADRRLGTARRSRPWGRRHTRATEVGCTHAPHVRRADRGRLPRHRGHRQRTARRRRRLPAQRSGPAGDEPRPREQRLPAAGPHTGHGRRAPPHGRGAVRDAPARHRAAAGHDRLRPVLHRSAGGAGGGPSRRSRDPGGRRHPLGARCEGSQVSQDSHETLENLR